ncbi:hotdog family protein [Legionella fallonii]|uniref:3-hydroxydecanoyl-[acyl-carrier-protein] dehydratase n=1 Tax=Legionella fallonii LLAP-10 TaxID=1212491 RepID=A0A098G2X1_9GAMM|nr:hypothetical protein [Legionella fallonii]CEG56334.1 3-hydroxydecanoyl-[acyl-carrier-protein] dehydratase [Legionella fallonii LLAP-10]
MEKSKKDDVIIQLHHQYIEQQKAELLHYLKVMSMLMNVTADIKLLSKPTVSSEVRGEMERGTGVDSSTVPTKQFTDTLTFRKKSIEHSDMSLLPNEKQVLEKTERQTEEHTSAPEDFQVIPTEQLLSKPELKSSKESFLFDRDQLVEHATGKVSSVFGAEFLPMDHYPHRIRLPAPPFLMVDRVLAMSIDQTGSSVSTITTETDIDTSKWYLFENRMPLGLMLEGAQGHMFLLSQLGLDFINKPKGLLYRMIGGQFEILGSMPYLGETIRYDIRVSPLIDKKIFKIEYDCYVRDVLIAIVRNGKVGFFSREEMEHSRGIQWQPKNESIHQELTLPQVKCTRSHFLREHIVAFANGDLFSCFGSGFEFGQTHRYSPRIPNGTLLMLNEIRDFDPSGGLFQRGYLRAIQKVTPDDWFFKCHFLNDSVLPGTLSVEATIQALAFYLAGMGLTLDKDGWRFEIVTEKEYSYSARGQVTPAHDKVIYELHVREVITAPYPTVFADILAKTSEEAAIYHIKSFGLRLVPDTPLSRETELLITSEQRDPNALIDSDGIILDYRTFLESALGKQAIAFGSQYHQYDEGKKMARLPAPPYQFLSRVTALQGEKSAFKTGTEVSMAYDIQTNAWYFEENNSPMMPFCVFLEALLQASGWLILYIGTVLQSNNERYVRNLEGSLHVKDVPSSQSGTLTTSVHVANLSSAGDMDIETFTFKSLCGDQIISEGQTTFGFFSKQSLAQQVGLPTTEAQLSVLNRPSNLSIDLNHDRDGYNKNGLYIAKNRLLMIDRITGYWDHEGQCSLGLLRAEKDVKPNDWFFKCHFYQDPVQPGSLGLEGMLQLLQFYLMQQTGWDNFTNPCFESPAIGTTINWKYRGQVLSFHKRSIYTMDILSLEKGGNFLLATAKASLWVDDKQIYDAHFSVRLANKNQD